jgi:hypothetical protein
MVSLMALKPSNGGAMRSRLLQLGVTGILSAALLCSAFGQGNSQGHGKGKGHNKHQDSDDQGESSRYFFAERDREITTRYYSNHGSNLPPGLAKRGGNLPPGLEKQLERNGTLPPGLQKRIAPCPVELERQLPPLPADYRRAVIGAHLVIFNRNTNVIVDVMKDVVR